ncbi:MAG TPA: flagellar basal body-associated FliL family protein [Terriglobales bacterium]|nr:flagellar basal body-associated FliL family protein [Terriglobales bacterium]
MGRRHFVAIASLLALLSLLSACSYFQKTAVKAAPKPTRLLALSSTVYNLADANPAYLKMGITLSLAMPDREGPKDNSQDGQIETVARDTLVNLVTAETSAVLLTASGKDDLKKAALEAMRKRLPDADIQDLYFDEFLVQR